MAKIDFTDTVGAATLRNRFPAPANRFSNWTPITRPVGDSVSKLSDGGRVMFRHRTDYGAAFDLAGIPVVHSRPPWRVSVTINPVGGTLVAGTYYYVVTAFLPDGQTGPSTEVVVVTSGAMTNSFTVTVPAIAGATSYRFYRTMTPGGPYVFNDSATPALTEVSSAGTAGSPPTSGVNLVAIADRLIAHLLNGGTCSVATEDSLARTYATCGLAPGSEPTLRLTDAKHLEYTLSLQLINLAGSPVRMDCVYV